MNTPAGKLLRFIVVWANAFLVELVQEAGPFQGSAKRQIKNAKRFLRRVKSFFKSILSKRNPKLSDEKRRALTEAVEDFIKGFERDVIKSLEKAEKATTAAEAEREFAFAARSLRTYTIIFKVISLIFDLRE